VNKNQYSQMTDAELRLQLRGLSKERELEHDLWPSIQANLQGSVKKKYRGLGFAMAASVALIAMMVLPLFSSQPLSEPSALNARIVTREVKAMDVEYHAALKEFASAKVAPEVQTQLQLLDDSANKLHQALNQSPQSTYLIPILRRTYLQRLQLTQRAIAFNFT
jgi:hypothetical protein